MSDVDEGQEFIVCRAVIARNCDRKVQRELADEDSTFDSEANTFICSSCWQRAMEFSGAGDATDVDVDEVVREVQDYDRNEEAASER